MISDKNNKTINDDANVIQNFNKENTSNLSLNDILGLENLYIKEINKTNSNIKNLKEQIKEYKQKILKLKK